MNIEVSISAPRGYLDSQGWLQGKAGEYSVWADVRNAWYGGKTKAYNWRIRKGSKKITGSEAKRIRSAVQRNLFERGWRL